MGITSIRLVTGLLTVSLLAAACASTEGAAPGGGPVDPSTGTSPTLQPPEQTMPPPSVSPQPTNPPADPNAYPLPRPTQLPPTAGRPSLTEAQIETAVSTASQDATVAAALGQREVAQVQVQATTVGVPGEKTAITVAFLFRQPIESEAPIWSRLCDIGGQTAQWRGVAARVGPGAEIQSSPIWMTGANCVGAQPKLG
ncbi:hypothetical protein AB0J90_26645 [Micromonospora sp. NPDC049523]|uniref:hypothetical protein n=1 Tax=Micromonospora sp. NPDC049523 TaxID=3155921 RepID=UPI00341B178E